MKTVKVHLSTRDQILDSAQFLLQHYGYNAFSFDNIAKKVGIKKPSIHHHFASKALLGVEVIKRYREQFSMTLESISEKYPDALSCLENYIQLFIKTYREERKFCVCGMLGAEIDSLPAILVDEVTLFFKLNQRWLAKILQQGLNEGIFHFKDKPAQRALYLLASLEGAMVVGRALKSETLMNKVGKTISLDLTT